MTNLFPSNHGSRSSCRALVARTVKTPGFTLPGKLALLALLLVPVVVSAQVDQTWISANANNDWSTTAPNWDAGVPWANGNNAIFGGTGETVELAGNVTVNSLRFSANGYTIADANNDSLLTLGASSGITVDAGLSATISEALTIGGINKLGAGTLLLNGANSFAGDVTVTAGILQLGSNTALGNTTGVTSVVSGAAVTVLNGVTVTGESIRIVGSGGTDFSGALQAGTGAATWNGPVLIDSGGARIGAKAGGILTVSGVIQNGTANTLGISGESGTGVVLINGTSNTYTGATQILRGILRLGATNALPVATTLDVDSSSANDDSTFDLNGFSQTVASLSRTGTGSGTGGSFITNSGVGTSTLTMDQTATSVYDGIIRNGTGIVAITKANTGSLTLSGANTYTGATNVNAGELIVGSATALGSTAGATTVANGARLVLANGVTVTGETVNITGTGGNNNGALQGAANGSATWAGNVVTSGGESRIGGGADGTLTVTGVISGTGNIVFSRGNNAVTILSGQNTYTGDTQIFANAGAGSVLRMAAANTLSPASRISVISNTPNTVNTKIDLNGFAQTVRGLDTTAQPTSGTFFFIQNDGAAPTTLTLNVTGTGPFTYTGKLVDGTSGAGGLSLVKEGSLTQIIASALAYTGRTTVNAGTLQLGVATTGLAGALASTDILLTGPGILALDNTGASNNSGARLSDAAAISFRGGAMSYLGSDQAATNSTETVGSFVLPTSTTISRLTNTFGGTNVSTLTAGQFTRAAGGGVLLVNGVGLGQNSGTSSVSRILLTTAPSLVGTTVATSTGINAASKNTQIVPYLLGVTSANTSGAVSSAGTVANTFMTYNATTGLRPLNPIDEFTQDAVVAGNNTRISNNTTMATSTAINSLIMSGGTLTLNQTLTNTSGALLFANGNTTITGGTLAFGSAEAIVTVNGAGINSFISSIITGTGGMTVNGVGTLVLGTQQSTYSGNTTLAGGVIIPQANSTGPAGAPISGPFGTGTVVLAGSALRATTSYTITVGNSVVLGANTAFVTSGTPANDRALTFTGPVTLTGGNHTVTQTSGAPTVFSGNIGEDASSRSLTVTATSTGPVVLGGSNTYTGGTTVTQGTLVASNTAGSATGTGDVSIAAGAKLAGTGRIAPAANKYVFINGTLQVGDPTLVTPVASSFTLATSGTGATTFATSSFVLLDILSGAGTGALSGASASDRILLSGIADFNLGGTIVLGNPNGLSGFTAGDAWTLFDLSGGGSITSGFNLDYSALGGVTGNFDRSTGVFTVTGTVPEPSRMMLLLLGGGALLLRRRKSSASL